MLQNELKDANDHIAFLTSMTNENLKLFGATLMKVEEGAYVDLKKKSNRKQDPAE